MANLANRDPMINALTLHRAINQLFEDSFWQPGSPAGMRSVNTMLVPMDLYETDQGLVLKASVPGLKPEDIEVTVAGDLLTIRGEYRPEPEEQQNQNFLWRERRYGSFNRQFTLPSGADTNNITASFDNGVLTLGIPKSEQVKPKNVKIRAKNK